jgi:alpha-beta hydrolase superfamily lysophospholipase
VGTIADLLKRTSTGYIWEQGGSVYDLLESAKMDLEGVVAFAQQLGYSEIILQGHSLGPHKICYYITHTLNNPIKRLIFLTAADVRFQFDSSVPNWEHYSLVAKEMIDNGQGSNLMPIRLWSNCPISAASFWNYTNQAQIVCIQRTHPKPNSKITLPMLVINPENDVATGVSAKKHMELIKQHSISTDFSSKIIHNAVHNFLSKEEELVDEISRWL